MAPHIRTAVELNEITSAIIRCAVQVHRALGPGLLERAYHVCLVYEMIAAHLHVLTEQSIPLRYKDVRLECAYKVDTIVNQCVLVEIKALDVIAGIHVRQMQTYLKLTNFRVGLLLNFGAVTMKNGIHRVVNNFPQT